jgi:hypothetical protein
MKDGFYEELEYVFDKFHKYLMEILLGDFSAMVGREDILKPTVGNESLHEISNDNGVNFATSKNLIVKSTWSDNKVRKLMAVKVLHNSLLNITVVIFKILSLGSYAPMPAPSTPFKQFWNWFCRMAFRAAFVLLLMSSISSKCLPYNISFIFGNRKKSLGLGPVIREGVSAQLFLY